MCSMFVCSSEVDYVCMDLMPRHHNIIRWRMGESSSSSSSIVTLSLVPIWRNGACLPRLHPGRNFFASGSRIFSE